MVMIMVMVFSSTFNNISAILWWSGSWSTWRTPSTCRKLL